MPRLTIEERPLFAAGMGEASDRASRRLAALPGDQCPLALTEALARLSQTQSCGKCPPCRIGLGEAADLIASITRGDGGEVAVDALRGLADMIVQTADCAIGFEAGRSIAESLAAFSADYAAHAVGKPCSVQSGSGIPCQDACPAHVDIPGYIACIKAGRYEDALRVIRNDNPLPVVCGYVCEHPCEALCRRTVLDDAVNICGLKRYAADNAVSHMPPSPLPDTGKSIAIVGGGPAGLTAAYFLRLMGHAVTIYDQREKLGGMVRYGIPDYRLPQHKLDADIDFILATGIEVQADTAIGPDVPYDEIGAAYDAVYLSIGAHLDKKLGCDGEDASGVVSAVAFLRAAGEGAPLDVSGQRVVVVGGGNVAMDCTRTARRLGAASVECVYRRRIADMTALPEEIEEAMAEGCQITQLESPVRIEQAPDGSVAALVTQPQVIGSYGRDGRPRPYAADAPERRIPCDVVVVAIGQAIETDAFAHVLTTEWGCIVAQPDASIAQTPGLFAGGDAVSGPSTVIKAIAAGKVAAANIDAALGFAHDVRDVVGIPAAGMPSGRTGRIDLKNRCFSEAIGDFDIAKMGMSYEEACQESARCLRCDHYGQGIMRGREKRAW